MNSPHFSGSLEGCPTFSDTVNSGVSVPVYVIDDDNEVRRSLHCLLASANLVSWPFASAADFLANLPTLTAAPILLDIRMPEMDGIQLLSVLRSRGIVWPIIVMTSHGEISVAVQAMKLGAMEFLEKPFEYEALAVALQKAFTLLSTITEAATVQSAACRRLESLSLREAEVLKVLIKGVPNKVAAHVLSLSVRTVEMHRANALLKLQVKSLAEVIHLVNHAEPVEMKESIR